MFAKILLAAVITASTTLALPTPVLAAPATQTEHRHPLEHLREAVEQLTLSPTQKTQIHKILEDAHALIKPLLQNAKNGNHEKTREEIHAIVKATVEKILPLLTEPQKHHLLKILHEEHAAAQTKK